MNLHTCKTCTWYQPLRADINGRTTYGCAYTKRKHLLAIDCPKYVKDARKEPYMRRDAL